MCWWQAAIVWLAMCGIVLVLSRVLAQRRVDEALAELKWVRRRIEARKSDLMLALEDPRSLDRERYVMLVNELMSLSQLEARMSAEGEEDV